MTTQILEDMRIADYEARVINQISELPFDRYRLTARNYRLKSLQNRISSNIKKQNGKNTRMWPAGCSLRTPELRTPVSLTGQKFSIQVPTSVPSCKSINSCNISSSIMNKILIHHE
ncbi:hypothetical protein QTO34_018676 [Cnephaeus nilssonii]|uniref:Uncharacterized protein n=1 Tax=Cnephaeus nilssonii TaxID=3371016 RepID=A0AA40LQD2_CNENI|nr:hypothetical protein QTO34_018676 [Eptesicus nilssonii]